jgi:hypothetical protein
LHFTFIKKASNPAFHGQPAPNWQKHTGDTFLSVFKPFFTPFPCFINARNVETCQKYGFPPVLEAGDSPTMKK